MRLRWAGLSTASRRCRWFLFRPAPARDETGKIVGWYGTITDIEDRKRAEDALRESEARLSKAEGELQHMLDTIPTLIVRGATNGYIEYLNKQWFEYTGTTLETARGMKDAFEICASSPRVKRISGVTGRARFDLHSNSRAAWTEARIG